MAISQWDNGAIYVNVNGHVEATTEIYDMKLQRMVGHLPALLHPNPRNRCWASDSARAFRRAPSRAIRAFRDITICEIEPVIPPSIDQVFRQAGLRSGAESAHAHRVTTTRATTC